MGQRRIEQVVLGQLRLDVPAKYRVQQTLPRPKSRGTRANQARRKARRKGGGKKKH